MFRCCFNVTNLALLVFCVRFYSIEDNLNWLLFSIFDADHVTEGKRKREKFDGFWRREGEGPLINVFCLQLVFVYFAFVYTNRSSCNLIDVYILSSLIYLFQLLFIAFISFLPPNSHASCCYSSIFFDSKIKKSAVRAHLLEISPPGNLLLDLMTQELLQIIETGDLVYLNPPRRIGDSPDFEHFAGGTYVLIIITIIKLWNYFLCWESLLFFKIPNLPA